MIDKLLITPFQKFVKIESFSGILLFIATLLALIWANSPLSHLYDSLWQYKIGITTSNFELNKPIILWINDGLMAVFFFLIGLEIKRELLIGELNTVRKASFPFFAALGGMLVPVAMFFLLNNNQSTSNAWGVPMATDIAFSLAILKLLGKRIPLGLKVFLTAFAIVDDLIAVLVIAIFYSGNIQWILLGYAVIPLAILIFLAYRKIYFPYFVFIIGVLVWYLFLKSGIHPTVAGVLMAFTIPIRQKIDIKTYSRKLMGIAKDIEGTCEKPILSDHQIEQIDNLEDWTSQVQSPLQHLEHKLHNWVAFFIMPVFALSNAGIKFGTDINLELPLVINIALCLIIGNSIGVSLISFIGIKLKFAELPQGVKAIQVVGISFLAGIGFTMAIFIANLAFITNPEFIDSAKIGILIGSFTSGVIGYLILRFGSRYIQHK
ncbi:Na+/H+ antiporter NhaA [Labilibaculum sp. K2S]|uniref:Na+/H+ antiporter NhaA n=1 Tax=Labilibaculum sp. K2S TaxID=3056386 RepID=UPI0025A31902|nr:Na+/H+ antiporter NhaA [Labilibaculum sp. K2S]MDM8158436.1 Na+/H+ antiporter NhaA [Labilibaculum sp. K2S]